MLNGVIVLLIQIHNLLSKAELDKIVSLLDGADWNSGHHSAGATAATQKANEEMDQSGENWQQINQLVVQKVYQHPQFQSAALPHRVSAAFVSRYTEGMRYKSHVDDPVMGSANGRYRSDIAVTVFLSDLQSYDGGELVIHTRFGPVTVKLPAGSAVVYPASSQHEVSEVTRGQRLACVLWAQSLVRDAHQREILTDLDDARRALKLSTPNAEVTGLVDQAYLNLVRMWSEV